MVCVEQEAYYDMLVKYREELTRPIQEAMDFMRRIETQLNMLCNGPVRIFNGTSSFSLYASRVPLFSSHFYSSPIHSLSNQYKSPSFFSIISFGFVFFFTENGVINYGLCNLISTKFRTGFCNISWNSKTWVFLYPPEAWKLWPKISYAFKSCDGRGGDPMNDISFIKHRTLITSFLLWFFNREECVLTINSFQIFFYITFIKYFKKYCIVYSSRFQMLLYVFV